MSKTLAVVLAALFAALFAAPTFAEDHASGKDAPAVCTLDGEVNDVSADALADCAKAAVASGAPSILLKLNSRGGAVMAEWQMERALMASGLRVDAEVDAICASACFMLLEGPAVTGTRTLQPWSTLMTHSVAIEVEAQLRRPQVGILGQRLGAMDLATAVRVFKRLGFASPQAYPAWIWSEGGEQWLVGAQALGPVTAADRVAGAG